MVVLANAVMLAVMLSNKVMLGDVTMFGSICVVLGDSHIMLYFKLISLLWYYKHHLTSTPQDQRPKHKFKKPKILISNSNVKKLGNSLSTMIENK